jgi:tRNA (cytidine32/uridine32-2'-O)-methyltransferase
MASLSDRNGLLPVFDEWDQPPAKTDDLEFYFKHLEQVLVDIGFHDKSNPRQTMTRLRRLYGRIRLDEMELSILRGVLTSIRNAIYQFKNNKD